MTNTTTIVFAGGLQSAIADNDRLYVAHQHYHVNNDEYNNEFAGRLFISQPVESTGAELEEQSKVFICDTNFMFPNEANIKYLNSSNTAGLTSDQGNSSVSTDVYTCGTVVNYFSTYTGSASTLKFRNVTTHPCVEIDADALAMKTDLFQADSNYRNTNYLNGFCLSIIDNDTGKIQTRYVIASKALGTSATDNILLQVHYPFGHAPAANDKWYIWKHSSVCTAPMRLMKQYSLEDHPLDTVVLKGDPTLLSPVFKGNGDIEDLTSTGTTTVATTDASHNDPSLMHHLSTKDKVRIECESDPDYDGVYEVTVTGPYTFEFTTSGSDLTDGVTATWKILEEDNSSLSNPLTIDLARPVLKSCFGGLDMRKLRVLHPTDVAGEHSTSPDVMRITVANKLAAGESITMQGADAEADGTYIVKTVNASYFEVYNTNNADDNAIWSNPVTMDQWETFVAATSSKMQMGELRSGLTNWDRGNIKANVNRYDLATASFVDTYMSVAESSVVIETSSLANQTGDFFQANTTYYYKLSLIYDGYQEGPLSNAVWTYKDTSTRNKLLITIKIKEPSRRLSHLCLYRKDNYNDYFKLVQKIPTDGGWRKEGLEYIRIVGDRGELGATYSARTGLSEVLDTIKLKYGVSAEIDGYLFAGDCSHERIRNASNMLFRSKPGMYSIWDYANDFLTLKSKPTALINFKGRLYAFDDNNIYRINQHSLTIEDVFEGVGCVGKDSVIVTEYGMFFADRNGAYMHDGVAPQRISESIHQGGDLTKFSGLGTDNINDVSWTSTVGNTLLRNPYVIFDAKTNAVLFIVDFKGNKTKANGVVSVTKSYIWCYTISSNRWDLWELAEDEQIGKPILGQHGEVLIPIGTSIFENRGGPFKRDFTWVSKKLSMNEDSIVKVFNKVKLNGITNSLISDGSYIESSDRLLLATSTGTINNSDLTYSSSATNYSQYRISGSSKKGRWLQIKMEDMTEPVDSLGIFFRRKSTK